VLFYDTVVISGCCIDRLSWHGLRDKLFQGLITLHPATVQFGTDELVRSEY
jgi:hypothetical protein